MRILYVAMASSIHVARFISQINHRDWDLHLFNSCPEDGPCHPHLRGLTLHGCRFWQPPLNAHPSIQSEGFWPLPRGGRLANWFARRFLRVADRHALRLAKLINKLRPDVIHSHEIQHSGYLMLHALKYLDGQRPPWIVTNWGSDIYFFGRLKQHEPQIRSVLTNCDYYTCETQRDVDLAAQYGFQGKVLLPVMPNPGGFRFEEIDPLRTPGPASQRPIILLKGYQGVFGRAQTAVYALELCKDVLRNHTIVVYSPSPEVAMAAEIMARDANLDLEVFPHTDDHQEILRLRGRARISIGLSISDAASISFLEALAMGSFPVQSSGGGAHEWIRDGEGGFIVNASDPHAVAQAIRRAVTDDALVDRATEANYQIARERLDFYKLRDNVVNWYEAICSDAGTVAGRIGPRSTPGQSLAA